MKILIFSWRGPGHPNSGGAEISTHEHAKGWVKNGCEVTLFTSSYPTAKSEEVVDGVKIIRRGRQVLGVHLEAFKWYLFNKHDRFDLVVDQFHGIPFFTPFFIWKKKIGFIHEVTREVWKLNPWSKPFNLIPAILGTLFEPLIFIFYRNTPFMTVSESTRDDLVSWGIPKENIRVIHNGIRSMKVKTKRETKKTLIYLGAISKDKGVEDVIEVFSQIPKKEDFQFWIVGKSDTKYLGELKQKCKESGIENKVKFWGYVDERNKFELLSKAYLLINPSIREGWGLVVIEAASVGTPTIGYNVAGLKDSVKNGETGILCEPNPEACTKAVLSLDETKYQTLRKNCLNWSKNFDWDKSSKQSLELIKSLLI